ncbi:hypothetical protein K5X82_18180 [Halosquirtibacter xylanolyticus]|uniref:hypothetical protein n=1 Tax=Halosquirtibacter xylanolyticus TaxID=3374599 RepID=UPI0037498702|nr:hypothetical protein K5X82_18180 [Prolixibacteraceae bacterium]
MVPPKIYELLDKYYEGTNSPSELNELVCFFKQTDEIPSDLLPDKVMILGVDGLHDRLIPKETMDTNKKVITPRWYRWVAAASIVAVISIVGVNELFETIPKKQPIYGYYNGKPITNRLVAAEQFNSTLNKISPSFLKMHKEVEKIEEMKKCNDVINKVKP